MKGCAEKNEIKKEGGVTKIYRKMDRDSNNNEITTTFISLFNGFFACRRFCFWAIGPSSLGLGQIVGPRIAYAKKRKKIWTPLRSEAYSIARAARYTFFFVLIKLLSTAYCMRTFSGLGVCDLFWRVSITFCANGTF